MNAYHLRDISNTHVIDTCVYIWQIQKLTIFLLQKKKLPISQKLERIQSNQCHFRIQRHHNTQKQLKYCWHWKKIFFVNRCYQ